MVWVNSPASTVRNESIYFCHVPEKKYFEQEPIQRRFGLVMYYISAGQTREFTLGCFYVHIYQYIENRW